MWETLRKEEIFKLLKTDRRSGITKEQVIERRQKYGGNKLEDKPKETMFIKFIKQFNDFMIIILILGGLIYLFLMGDLMIFRIKGTSMTPLLYQRPMIQA